jgi:hypothetical protein
MRPGAPLRFSWQCQGPDHCRQPARLARGRRQRPQRSEDGHGQAVLRPAQYSLPVAPCSGLQVAQSRRAVICCSAACLPQLDRLPRFGVEVFLNALWISSARRLAVVRWDAVESPSKSRKHGLVQGITGDLGMLRDILQTVGIKTAAQQIMRLRRQRVRP